MRAALLTLLTAVLSQDAIAAQGAGATSTRIVVRDVASTTPPSPIHGRVHAAIVDAIHGALLTVVSEDRLPERLARCVLPGCLTEIAAATGATHVLNVNAKLENESFQIVIELWDVAGKRLVTTEKKDCLICDREDFVKAVGDRTSALLDRSFLPGGTPAPADGRMDIAPAVVPLPARKRPEPDLLARPAPPPDARTPPQTWSPLPLWGGVTVEAGSLALILYGIHLWRVDGDPACRPGDIRSCDLIRDTKGNGTLLVIGGAVGALAGGGLIFLARPTTTATVSIGPRGLALAGRF